MLNLNSTRRGYEVYKQVCSNCHSLSLFKLNDLSLLDYSKAQIKQECMFFKIPANKYFTKTNNSMPNINVPDLCFISTFDIKKYIYNILLGYVWSLSNPFRQIFYNYGIHNNYTSMPPFLIYGAIRYTFKYPKNIKSVINYVRDVSIFINWVSRPWELHWPTFIILTICFSSIFLIINFINTMRIFKNNY